MVGSKRLGEILMAQGRLTREQLEEALQVQRREGRRRLLGQILVSRGYVSAAAVKAALAKQRLSRKEPTPA